MSGARLSGFCSSCGQRYMLRADGMVRHHTSWQVFQWGAARELCDGVGEAPVVGAVAEQARAKALTR